MKYFLIHNDYQYLMVKHYIESSGVEYNYKIILVKHRITINIQEDYIEFRSPMLGLLRYFYPFYMLLLRYLVSKELKNVSAHSQLFLFTEYDPANMFFVAFFKKLI